jgi:hypothetical protein
MLTGRVDELKNNKIYGWAFNAENPGEHLVIRIMQGPRVIASGVANVMRIDLPDAGVGDGDHAFEIPTPTNISSFQGLMVIAQSVRDGEIALPIASNDDRRLDELFDIFSERYESALIALKEGIDTVADRCEALEKPRGAMEDLPADLAARLAKMEERMEATEVFLLRMDEQIRQLTDKNKKTPRKRFLGLF